MKKPAFLFALVLLLSCGNDSDTENDDGQTFQYASFARRFKTATLPFHITDTGLLRNRDTATLRNVEFLAYMPDSLKKRLFGKQGRMKLTPLVMIDGGDDAESYFVIKAWNAQKKMALVYAFDKEEKIWRNLPPPYS